MKALRATSWKTAALVSGVSFALLLGYAVLFSNYAAGVSLYLRSTPVRLPLVTSQEVMMRASKLSAEAGHDIPSGKIRKSIRVRAGAGPELFEILSSHPNREKSVVIRDVVRRAFVEFEFERSGAELEQEVRLLQERDSGLRDRLDQARGKMYEVLLRGQADPQIGADVQREVLIDLQEVKQYHRIAVGKIDILIARKTREKQFLLVDRLLSHHLPSGEVASIGEAPTNLTHVLKGMLSELHRLRRKYRDIAPTITGVQREMKELHRTADEAVRMTRYPRLEHLMLRRMLHEDTANVLDDVFHHESEKSLHLAKERTEFRLRSRDVQQIQDTLARTKEALDDARKRRDLRERQGPSNMAIIEETGPTHFMGRYSFLLLFLFVPVLGVGSAFVRDRWGA